MLVPVGSYKITAEAPGFRRTVTDAQALDINQSLRTDVKMEVGSTTETVQVEANAVHVETQVATLRQTVSGSQIQEAPSKDRNVLDLARLSPGVIPNVSGNGTFSIAGERGDSVTQAGDHRYFLQHPQPRPFGQISGTADPRILQFTARWTF
jgi:hypothetical protein